MGPFLWGPKQYISAPDDTCIVLPSFEQKSDFFLSGARAFAKAGIKNEH